MRQPRTNQLIKAIAKGGGRRLRKSKRMGWFPRIIANTTVNRISNIDQLHSVNLENSTGTQPAGDDQSNGSGRFGCCICQSISTCYYIMLDLCTVSTPVLNIVLSIDGDA